MKKLLSVLLAVIMVFGVAACNSGEKTPTSEPENTSIPRLFTPVISVSKSGVATWTNLDGATLYKYKIDGGEEVETDQASYQLELNQAISVKCVGDNVTRRDSRWSDAAKFVPSHSFVRDNNNQQLNSVNIYKEDGTVVLDTINGTKTEGDVIKPGVKYVFEFDITMGPYHNGLLLAGVDNSVISDFVWSDSPYNRRDGEKVDSTDSLYEVNYDPVYNLFPDYSNIHRYHWSYTNEFWGMSTYGWGMKSTPAKNTNGVYDTREAGFWTVEPNWCSTLYGAHFLGSGKESKTQTDNGYKYVRFAIEYDKISTLSTGMVDSVEIFGALLGRERFNLFAIIHQNPSYIYFDSNNVVEYEYRDSLKANDENGEKTDKVNVYDAETGSVLLGTMTDENDVGEVLTTGKKYVFEFDVSGEKNGPVIFTGTDNAKISDVVWSDKLYSAREGETTVVDKLGILGLDRENHHFAVDEPKFHRIWKTADGYKGNYLRDCTMSNGVVNTADNLHDESMTCLEFAKTNWFSTKQTSKETGKKYFRMTIEFNSFRVIQVGAPVTDTENPNYGLISSTFFNFFLYSPAGGTYMYLTQFSPT